MIFHLAYGVGSKFLDDMKRLLTISFLAIAIFALIAPPTLAQESAEDTVFVQYSGLPRVNLIKSSVNLQQSLYPDYYKTHSALRDLRWVERNDSLLVSFWHKDGPFILHTLSELSGLQWLEGELDFYLLRYYPKAGNGDPLIVPLGGIRKGTLTETMPSDTRMELNIIYRLAHRMLSQAERFDEGFQHPIASHPLMQPGHHRRDNLAMLLALVTCEKLRGLDSTFAAYQSSFWVSRHPGREVFEKFLLTKWILAADQPLTRWILNEKYNSELVALTRPPRQKKQSDSDLPREYIEDLPLNGSLGFSLKIDRRNKRVVHKIDLERIAFACGLREGDVIRSVDGQRVRHQRDLIEKILTTYQAGGSTLQIVRDEESLTILLQPLDLGYDLVPYEWQEQDSTFAPGESEPFETEPADSSDIEI